MMNKVNGSAHSSARNEAAASLNGRPRGPSGSKPAPKGNFVIALEELATTTYLRTRIHAQTRLQAWGRLVATRQITVLMLCSVFLCALMYPVLSLYAWAAPSTGSDFFGFLRTSPTWSLMATYDGKSVAPTARDLHLPWQDMDGVVVNIEEACWQRIPKFREVTIQQVLIGVPFDQSSASEHGILDRRALHTLHKVEKDLQGQLMPQPLTSSTGIIAPEQPLQTLRCASTVKEDLASGPSRQTCFTLSPMAYWNCDEAAMLSDASLIATVNAVQPDALGLPVRHDNLFVNRVHSGETMRKADYAVITLFLAANPARTAIVKLISHVGSQHGLQLSSRNPAAAQQAVLNHLSNVANRSQKGINAVYGLAYVIVGFYIYLTLRRMDRVHSRTGLVLTGIVQMLISGMASISLCALAGYKIDLVPWKLIPFLIVVLGVDNMFVLVQSVTETSVNMPVKERIAQGLGQSGTSIFVNMIAELFALYLLYIAIPTRVIREMVVFGAVALVVDYAMEMTYFVTVLSIDMQRLELADLITQGTGASRKPRTYFRTPPEFNKAHPRFVDSAIVWLRHRKARTYAALGLVAANLFFYFMYGGEYFVPTFCSNVAATDSIPHISSTSSASDALWRLLGASSAQAMHVHIASPLVLHFSASPAVTTFAAVTASAWAVTKYVVLPISLTTFALYLLLLHLLKGSEQLQSEDSNESFSMSVPAISLPVTTCLATAATFYPLQRDDLVICNYDDTGSVAAFWTPARNSIVLQYLDDSNRHERDAQLRVASSERISCIELSTMGGHCAAISNKGRLYLWNVSDPSRPLNLLIADGKPLPADFCQLGRFCNKPTRRPDSGNQNQAVSSIARELLRLTAVGLDGALYTILPHLRSCEVVVAPVSRPHRASLSHSGGSALTYFCRQMLGSHLLEIWQETETSEWTHVRLVNTGRETDAITCLRFLTTPVHKLLAIGWDDGFVSIFDVRSGVRLSHHGETSQQIQQIRLVDVSGSSCPTCSQSFDHSVLLVAASVRTMNVSRLLPSSSDVCECPAGSPMFSPARSTINLVLPSGGSPSRATVDESRLSATTATSYPLSPHALRRLSQTNDKRKAVELAQRLASTSASIAEPDSGPSSTTGDVMSTGNSARPSLMSWRRKAVGSMRLDDKGCWDTCDSKIIGVRRLRSSSDQSRLARWELYSISLNKLSGSADLAHDITSQSLQTCLLTENLIGDGSGQKARSQAHLPFDRVRLFRTLPDNTSIGAAFGNLHVQLIPESASPAASTLCMSRAVSRTFPQQQS